MQIYSTIHLLPFIKEKSMFIRVNRIFSSAFQISITQVIVSSRGGWFGSSIVFQDDAVVMLLYWRERLLLVGERKFYGHVTMKDYTN